MCILVYAAGTDIANIPICTRRGISSPGPYHLELVSPGLAAMGKIVFGYSCMIMNADLHFR
jgi:hypothetical protein